MSLRKRVYDILDAGERAGPTARAVNTALFGLILLNIAAIIAETVPAVSHSLGGALRWFEMLSVGIFTLEYVLRVWSIAESDGCASPVGGRLRYMATPMAAADLLAVLPFYLPFTGLDLRFIRGVRLLRLLRIAKMGRYSQSLRTLGRVFASRRSELLVALTVLVLILLTSSALIYYAEHDAQPDVFSSIPASMWWSVATLTTIGYGDVYPKTTMGKAIASVVAIFGIGMFALPTGILGAGFIEEMQNRRRRAVCPHCGKPLDESGTDPPKQADVDEEKGSTG